MKKLLISLCLLSLSGCATVVKTINQVGQVRDAVNGLLPSDFKGDADLSRHDMYFDITLKAGNLHKNAGGEWTWDWIAYHRHTNLPITGFAWTSDVDIKLGAPKS